MQNIQIAISQDGIYEEVIKTTAYIGGKNVDQNGHTLYDQVFVTDVDKEMLDRFLLDAVENASLVLSEVIKSVDSDDEGYLIFDLLMTDNFPKKLQSDLQQAISSYLQHQIIAEWCGVSAKGEAEKYTTEAAVMLRLVNSIIYKRCRPIRNF